MVVAEGRAPRFMSITALNLAFYYDQKQLTFHKTVSLTTKEHVGDVQQVL